MSLSLRQRWKEKRLPMPWRPRLRHRPTGATHHFLSRKSSTVELLLACRRMAADRP
jgi:hypothetical protein